jgi:hypothetical protein
MELVSLRMIAVSAGAMAVIAACGGTGPSAANSFGSQATTSANTGMDATTDAKGMGAATSGASSGSGSMGAMSNDDSGMCGSNCNTNDDCMTACGGTGANWCCAAGTCFMTTSGSCETEGGASSDDGSAGMVAPAPSM